jgi:hypothetical protein
MSTVKDLFHLSGVVTGDLGVEIEVEGRNLPEAPMGWRGEHDGSLRGESREYVLTKPQTIAQVDTRIKRLKRAFSDNGGSIDDSVRAGVHVHVNVRHLTIPKLANFMAAYLVLEELLLKHCGEFREGNLFCLRSCDAEYLLYYLSMYLQPDRVRLLGSDDVVRYSAMNVCSLPRYGSLEFRALRTPQDLDKVTAWASVLLNLRKVAEGYENPQKLLANFNPMEFTKKFLGNSFTSLTSGYDFESMAMDGYQRILPIFTDIDWALYKGKVIGGIEFPMFDEFPQVPPMDV